MRFDGLPAVAKPQTSRQSAVLRSEPDEGRENQARNGYAATFAPAALAGVGTETPTEPAESRCASQIGTIELTISATATHS